MRDQYAGDISDLLKFSLLRALVGEDRRLGVAWYYAPGDDGKRDGRHTEWKSDVSWRRLNESVWSGLSGLPERSISALEKSAIWPENALFHNEPVPTIRERSAWAARKREALDQADLVFLDPDNGLGVVSSKHASFDELRQLRKPGRAVIFITFPGRGKKHPILVKELQERLKLESEAQSAITLRTSVCVPVGSGLTRSKQVVSRQRWFTIVDADAELEFRLKNFAESLAGMPRVKVHIN